MKNINGYPVANVGILVNENYRGITNSLGYLEIANLDYDTYDIIIQYRVGDENTSQVYQRTAVSTVNQPQDQVTLTALLPGNAGYSSTNTQTVSSSALIAGLALAIDITSVALSTDEFCKCIHQTNETTVGVQGCVTALAACGNYASATFNAFMPLNAAACSISMLPYAPIIQDQCLAEGAFFVGDIASPFVPIGIIGHAAFKFINLAPDLRLLGKIQKIEKKIGNVVEFIAENGDHYIAEAIGSADNVIKVKNVGVKPSLLTAAGRNGANAIYDLVASKTSKNIAKQKLTEVSMQFGEGRMKEIYDSIGITTNQITNPNYTPETITWINSVADKVKNFDSTNSESISNLSGSLREIYGAKAEGVLSSTQYAGVTIQAYGPIQNGVGDLTDFDNVADGILREFKSPGVNTAQLQGQIDRFRQLSELFAMVTGTTYNQIKVVIVKLPNETVPQETVNWLVSKKNTGFIDDWVIHTWE